MSKELWVVAKQELEAALALVTVVPPRGGTSSSEYIRVSKQDKQAIMQMASEIAAVANISSPYPFKESLYLDRRLFEPFVLGGRDLKAQDYVFKMNGSGLLTVKHGSRVAMYAKNRGAYGYSLGPIYKHARKGSLDDSWTKMLQCAVACATNDPVTPKFNCVYMVPTKDGVALYSSNTKIVFLGTTHTKKKPEDKIAFPLLLASYADLDDMAYLTWDDKSATLSSPRGSIWQAVKVEARKAFPKKEIDNTVGILSKGKSLFLINSESLGTAAERISSYLTAVSREDLVLKMELTSGEKRMKLSSGTGATRFTEYVALAKPSVKDIVLEWPLAEVLPVLVFCKSKKVPAEVFIADSGITMYRTRGITLVIAKKKG